MGALLPTTGDCAQRLGSGSVDVTVQNPQNPQNRQMDAAQLAEHLRLLTVASRDDLDELLTDLLCHVYRTKDAQNG